MVTQNQRGVLALPCLLALLVIATAEFGVWGVLRRWKNKMETQLRLDECVGKKATKLKSVLKTLERSNQRMTWVRRGAALAFVAPEALQAVRVELEAEFALQEGLKMRWNLQAAPWLAGKGCSAMRVQGLRYPVLSWERLPEDGIGPEPFEWIERKPEFHISALTGTLASGASVKEDENEKEKWRAEWESPVGSGLH